MFDQKWRALIVAEWAFCSGVMGTWLGIGAASLSLSFAQDLLPLDDEPGLGAWLGLTMLLGLLLGTVLGVMVGIRITRQLSPGRAALTAIVGPAVGSTLGGQGGLHAGRFLGGHLGGSVGMLLGTVLVAYLGSWLVRRSAPASIKAPNVTSRAAAPAPSSDRDAWD